MSTNQLEDYLVKTIEWNGKKVNIITQNENGPCPLVAICNVLFLRGDIVIPELPTVSFEYLVEILGDHLLALEHKSPLEDILNVLPKLKSGLDMNVLFDSIHGFESTPELAVFDLFNVELVHGWIVDPQDITTYDVIVKGCRSYNQTVECIVQAEEISAEEPKTPETEENLHRAFIANEFLKDTATQLTYYGLELLLAAIPPNKICALFRNNHFCTVYRHSEFGLLMLVTDSGFVKEKSITWESLGDVDQGSAEFFNDSFHPRQRLSGINQQDIDLEGSPSFFSHALAISLQETPDPSPQVAPVQQHSHQPSQQPVLKAANNKKANRRKSQCIIS
ncbi:hypothetical protein BY458DRAFT_544415 [Sporodiniella umbellata]|nr:hypothetical protein BY458DRAFT_544415 [Sporodiniella umbellata]